MSPEQYALFLRLAEGRVLSAQELSKELGITREVLNDAVMQLRAMGMEIDTGDDHGLCAAWAVETLDARRIDAALSGSGVSVEVLAGVESTNAYLAGRDEVHRHAVLAEYQGGGRGRRDRRWHSPPGAGIYLTFSYRFDHSPRALGPLSLVAGLAASETVRQEAGVGVGLKWPNDLVVADRKLGGCLAEVQGDAGGPCTTLIGVGINVRLPATSAPDQPWTDLWSESRFVARNRLAAALVHALDRACGQFQDAGFAPFRERWAALDTLAGRRVRVSHIDGRCTEGIADGVSERGGLYLMAGRQRCEFNAGEVSLRAG